MQIYVSTLHFMAEASSCSVRQGWPAYHKLPNPAPRYRHQGLCRERHDQQCHLGKIVDQVNTVFPDLGVVLVSLYVSRLHIRHHGSTRLLHLLVRESMQPDARHLYQHCLHSPANKVSLRTLYMCTMHANHHLLL